MLGLTQCCCLHFIVYAVVFVLGSGEGTNENQGWQLVDGKLTWVATGQAGIWGVFYNNNESIVYYRNGTYSGDAGTPSAGSDWIPVLSIPPSSNIKQLSVGPNIVWAVTEDNKAYYRNGINSSNHKGSNWIHATGQFFKRISVSTNGDVWGLLNNGGQVYRRKGLNVKSEGTGWGYVGNNINDALDVSVGQAGVWGIRNNVVREVYYRKGTYGASDTDGKTFESISSGKNMKQVSVGNNIVWAVDQIGNIFYRDVEILSNKR